MTKTILMRMPQVEAAVGLKKSSIYAKIKAGDFPAPYRLGSKSIAFKSDQIQEWIDTRPPANQEAV